MDIMMIGKSKQQLSGRSENLELIKTGSKKGRI